MNEIRKNLYQFSIYIPPMDFTIYQYLLASDPAILFAAGTVQQAEAILPDIRNILGDRKLKYIFVSHMESDEAGGVEVLKKAYPHISVICSGLAAREFPGYGFDGNILMKRGGEELSDGNLKLKFIDYPAEVHLQDGLLCFDENSGIFYSADLMLRFGNGVGKTIDGSWQEEVQSISEERVPVAMKREKLKEDLMQLTPAFIAAGHGFCVNLQ